MYCVGSRDIIAGKLGKTWNMQCKCRNVEENIPVTWILQDDYPRYTGHCIK